MSEEVSTLARPYAKAAFDIAKSDGDLTIWDNALAQLTEAVSSDEVDAMLQLPMISESVKTEMLADMIKVEKPAGFDNFLKLLGENNRLGVVDNIHEQYAELMRSENNELVAEVISALPIDDERQEKMRQALGKRFGKDVTLDITIDESLVGGAIVRTKDMTIDGSVSGHIEQLERKLH